MNKMTNKILQLSSSARDKLIQLGIFQQIKEAFLGISTFEELIGSVLAQVPIDVHFFLNCLIDHSRKRFFDKIDQNPDAELEPYRNKALEMPQLFQKLELNLNLAKVTSSQTQKGLSPQASSKLPEEPKIRESVRIRNLEPNNLYRKDFIKGTRNPLAVKSVDSRSSFEGRDFQEKALKEVNKPPELSSINEPAYQSLNAIKDTPTKEKSLREEVLALALNLNSPNVNQEKTVGSMQSNNSSRFSNVKKVKITSNSSSIKKSLCLEEPKEPQQTDQDKDKKDKEKDKPNKEAWLKNYDILKIEYTPLPTATKKETKKLLLEKVYNQLLGSNTDIKKTMKRYRTSHLAYAQKKQSENEAQKEEAAKDNSTIIVETNRPKSLTPHSYANIPPAKPKPSAVHANHRNLLSIENPKDTTEDVIDPNSEHFINILNHFSGSLSSKQSKDLNSKKGTSQKFLVLPKLNLNADSQGQGIFPCWPPVLQGSKSAAKSNFTIDFGNRARFSEKPQKGSERLVHHLMLDTKQDMSDQETLNTSLANAPTLSTNPRVYSNFSNKNNFPLTLQPLDAVSTVNNKPLVL